MSPLGLCRAAARPVLARAGFSGARKDPLAHFGPDLSLVNWPVLVRAENRQPIGPRAKTGHHKCS